MNIISTFPNICKYIGLNKIPMIVNFVELARLYSSYSNCYLDVAVKILCRCD